jgi:hypothetical protein
MIYPLFGAALAMVLLLSFSTSISAAELRQQYCLPTIVYLFNTSTTTYRHFCLGKIIVFIIGIGAAQGEFITYY